MTARCSVGHFFLSVTVCARAATNRKRVAAVSALASTLGLGRCGWWVPCMPVSPDDLARPVTTEDYWPDDRSDQDRSYWKFVRSTDEVEVDVVSKHLRHISGLNPDSQLPADSRIPDDLR